MTGRLLSAYPAPSWTLEDGTTEKRFRLYRPMERTTLSARDLAESNWQKTGPDIFAKLWRQEAAEVPEFTTTRFHIITGLLLPI